MLGKLQKDQKGFTIIEVLIVLAIAGLIMLIVFLAIPALQRNQRNNARNSEASRVSSAVTECLANRNGQQESCKTYANLGITQSGSTLQGYQQFTAINWLSNGTASGGTTATPADYPNTATTSQIAVTFGVKCAADGASSTATGASARDFTVIWLNEPSVKRCIGSESN